MVIQGWRLMGSSRCANTSQIVFTAVDRSVRGATAPCDSAPQQRRTNHRIELVVSPVVCHNRLMAAKRVEASPEEFDAIRESLVQLARLSLSGRDQDTALFVQRIARRFRRTEPALADALVGMLRDAPTRSSPLRRAGATSSAALPVDTDSRLDLVRVEDPPIVEVDPILPAAVMRTVQQLVDERRRNDELSRVGLAPTRTALLLGPPGVGKTMTARWIAASLEVPLLVLDLSAVMSSLLGRTGVNLRYVLDYAKAQQCVLLIDELDSIGKRRNDDADVGELKRLVNVLLQQLDDWPAHGGLLLGATNHAELLDPAIWRRFEVAIEFPIPDLDARAEAVRHFSAGELGGGTADALARMYEGLSFGEIESALQRAHRAAALGYGSFTECVAESAAEHSRRLAPSSRRELAVSLVEELGVSQRLAHELTGVSRDTIRKLARSK